MRILKKNQISEISKLLLDGFVGVLPTDTVYGLHCLAHEDTLVKRIHDIKGEDYDKPLIVLISDYTDLVKFNVDLNEYENEIAKKYWPGHNTLIFTAKDGTTKSFRIPQDSFLTEVLKVTGPLVSTSANIHGKPQSNSINEACDYFGVTVDFYVDGGNLNNPPSSIYKIEGNNLIKLR